MTHTPEEQPATLLESLSELELDFNRGAVHTGDFLRFADSHGLPLVTLLVALPFCFPIPLPGLSIPFGAILVICAFQMLWNRRPWLPARLERVVVPRKLGLKIIGISKRIVRFVERDAPPPTTPPFIAHRYARMMLIMFIMLGGFLLALPLPPGTNFPPGVLVVLSSVALLRHSLVTFSLSLISLALNAGFFFALWELGSAGIKAILGVL